MHMPFSLRRLDWRSITHLVSFASGLYILRKYLIYLQTSPKALLPDPADNGLKLGIFCAWMLLCLGGIWLGQKKLARNPHIIEPGSIARALIASLLFCISVTAYNPPDVELSFYFFINSIAYFLILYPLLSLAPVQRFCGILGGYVLRLWRIPGLYWVAAAMIWIFSMSYYLGGVLFQHFPWIDDTIVQLVHAKFLLTGHWYGESHPLPRFFDMKMMINDGKWYSQYPPGHIIMLAIGTALGHAEMVNPFLGACTVIPIYLLAKEIYGTHVAKMAVLLTAMCAYLIIFSSEYMSNATSLLTATFFLWAYVCVLNDRGMRYAVIAGAAIGYCFITRPYSAVGFALPCALYAMYLIVTKPRIYARDFIVMGGVVTCFIGFQLYYNHVTTGDALVFGYQKLQGAKHIPFSHDAIDSITAEKIYKRAYTNLQRLSYFNRILFEGPLPAMALIALVCVSRPKRDERLLLVIMLSMFLSLEGVGNKDIGWGPRLLYELNGILLVLCAKNVMNAPAFVQKMTRQRLPIRTYHGAGMLVLAAFYAFSCQYNLHLSPIRHFYNLNDREGNPTFYKTIMQQVTPPALIIVPLEYYKFVSFNNPPNDTNPVIFASGHGEKNVNIMGYYKDRNVYGAMMEDGKVIVRMQ